MLRGLYTAASSMIAQQRQQESLSNNLANVNTPGYKADAAVLRSFPDMLIHQLGSTTVPTTKGFQLPIQREVGSLHTGVYVHEMVPNYLQGDLNETGVNTDLAILTSELPDELGSLFFSVQNDAGEERLTRNGNFTVDGQGFLVTTEGHYVLDENENPIETNTMAFTIHTDGTIQLEDGNIGLGITYAPNANDLIKEGNGLLSGDTVAAPEAASYTIQQGFLERSNVDSLQTMTDMMSSFRMFETSQRVLKAYDENLGKAVTEIGRLG